MNKIKFLHLQVGQQFEYQGRQFTKVAPLIASNNETGKQKMIPRSALVVTQEGTSEDKPTKQAELPPAISVLERYHQTVLAELQSITDDEPKLGAARARLEALRQELEEAIRRS